MLTLTQATGQQIQPLLNLQVKAPNFAPLDAELARIQEEMKLVSAESQQLGTSQNALVPPIENTRKSLTKQRDEFSQGESSIRGMRREAVHIVGALAFVSSSILDMAGNASNGNPHLEKMASVLREGVGAGFGLASTLSLIPGVTGPVAIGIGSVVGVGTALAKVLGDDEAKSKSLQIALNDFVGTLRGASKQALEEQRVSLQKVIVQETLHEEQMKKSSLQAAQYSLFNGGLEASFLNLAAGIFGGTSQLKQHQADLEALNKQLGAFDESAAEREKRVNALRIQSEDDAFKQRKEKAEEDKRLRDQDIADRTKDDKDDADRKSQLLLSEQSYNNDLRKIRDDELKQKEEHAKLLIGLEAEIEKAVTDAGEKMELATARTELERIAITERYAIRRLETEKKAALESIDLEINRLEAIGGADAKRQLPRLREQKQVVSTKFETQENVVRTESAVKVDQIPIGSIKDQEDLIKGMNEDLARENDGARRDEIRKQIEFNQQWLDRMKLQGGLIAAQQEAVKEAEQRVLDADDDATLASAKEQLRIEKDKYDKLTLSAAEYAQKLRQQKEQERRLWTENNQFALGIIQGITDGFRDAFRSIIAGQSDVSKQTEIDFQLFKLDRQKRETELRASLAKGEISQEEYSLRVQQLEIEQQKREEELNKSRETLVTKAWNTIRDKAINDLEEMLGKELENLVIGEVAHVAAEEAKTTATAVGTTARSASNVKEVASNLSTFASSAASGVAKAAQSAAALPFPLNIAAIAAAIAATVGLFLGIKKVFGFEEGGRVRKGQIGYFEGAGDEIIAPEKTFLDVMRGELAPKIIMQAVEQTRRQTISRIVETQTRVAANGSKVETARLERVVDGIRAELDSWAREVKFVQDGQDMSATLKLANGHIDRLKF